MVLDQVRPGPAAGEQHRGEDGVPGGGHHHVGAVPVVEAQCTGAASGTNPSTIWRRTLGAPPAWQAARVVHPDRAGVAPRSSWASSLKIVPCPPLPGPKGGITVAT